MTICDNLTPIGAGLGVRDSIGNICFPSPSEFPTSNGSRLGTSLIEDTFHILLHAESVVLSSCAVCCGDHIPKKTVKLATDFFNITRTGLSARTHPSRFP